MGLQSEDMFAALLDLFGRADEHARRRMADLHAALTDSKENAKKLQADLDEERRKVQQLRVDLQRLTGSMSWRITMPLRGARFHLGRFVRMARGG
jgi:hypothetical protein